MIKHQIDSLKLLPYVQYKSRCSNNYKLFRCYSIASPSASSSSLFGLHHFSA